MQKITIIENNKSHFSLLKDFLDIYQTNEIDIKLIREINNYCSNGTTPKAKRLKLEAREYLMQFFESNRDSLCFVIDYQINEDSGKEHVNADNIIELLSSLKINNFFILSGKLSPAKRNEFTTKGVRFIEKVENWSEKQYLTVQDEMKKNLINFISTNFSILKIGILSVLPVENQAIKKVFNITDDDEDSEIMKGHLIYVKEICIKGVKALLYIGCYGKAGNVNSGNFTTLFIEKVEPKALILFGIAVAVNNGKIKIGDVYHSRSVSSAEKTIKTISGNLQVPSVKNVSTPILNMYSNHSFDSTQYHEEIRKIFNDDFILSPLIENVVSDMKPSIDDCSINSEDSLFRIGIDEVKDLNPESKLSEMEAQGFVSACDAVYNKNVPWLVIRSVSDFGAHKENNYQSLACAFGAVYVKYFIEEIFKPNLIS